MKELKFLILVLGLMLAQGVMAVTLPSTSYTPYYSGDSYASNNDLLSGVSLPQTSYSALGEGESCVSTGSFALCESCCQEKENTCFSKCSPGDMSCADNCRNLTKECKDECGRSLPLDAPLWFMLVIAVLSVTLRAYARRVSQAA